MKMHIHCPGCSLELYIPPEAAGRRARCPSCRIVFVVPQPQDLYESEVALWIEHDVQDEESQRLQMLEAQLQQIAASNQPTNEALSREVAKLRAKRQAAPGGAVGTETGAGDDSPGDNDASLAGQASLSTSADAMDESMAGAVAAASGDSSIDMPAMDGTALDEQMKAQPRHAMPIEGGDDHGYPQSLFVTEAVPHLIVRSCTQDGVELAFDACWLDHDGFRLSMPVRDVYEGQTGVDKLIARPLAFIDRSQAAYRTPRDLERKVEMTLHARDPIAALLSRMRRIEHLPQPFDKPMPYYVATGGEVPSLVCTTHQREDSGFTCSVTIPDGRYALDWLANVNGICGPEYAMLQRDIGDLWSDAWSQLSERSRQRIAVWCHFEAGEHFRAYLTDVDFKRRDEGLAGLVVTDHRIVYCKYHHRGAVRFADGVRLLLREDPMATRVYAVTPTGRTRLAKLHTADIPRFTEAVEHVQGLNVVRESVKT